MPLPLFAALSDEYGNIASVLGLAVSVAGLVLTVVTFLRVKRVETEARRLAQEAVGRVGQKLLADDVATLVRLMKEARDAERHKQWPRAIDRWEEVRIMIAPLAEHPNLQDEERDSLVDAATYIPDIVRHLEGIAGGPATEQPTFSARKRKSLDRLVSHLGAIQGRLQSTALEVPDVNP